MSERPIRLDKALTKGRLRIFQLKPAEKRIVPFGCAWIILSGIVNHVTGTDSSTVVHNQNSYIWRNKVLAAVASGQYPLFNTVADPSVSLFTPIITVWGKKNLNLSDIYFSGATNSYVKVQILEWEL